MPYRANSILLCVVDVQLDLLPDVVLHQHEEVLRIVEDELRSTDHVVCVGAEAGGRSG
jgi:hypothetical protein